VWSDGVVIFAPTLDQYLRFAEGLKQFPVQQFISELAVERFTVTVLPRAARRDVQVCCAESRKPPAVFARKVA